MRSFQLRLSDCFCFIGRPGSHDIRARHRSLSLLVCLLLVLAPFGDLYNHRLSRVVPELVGLDDVILDAHLRQLSVATLGQVEVHLRISLE